MATARRANREDERRLFGTLGGDVARGGRGPSVDDIDFDALQDEHAKPDPIAKRVKPELPTFVRGRDPEPRSE